MILFLVGSSKSRGRLPRTKKTYDISYRCSVCGKVYTYLARAKNHEETNHEGRSVMEILIKDDAMQCNDALIRENVQLKDELIRCRSLVETLEGRIVYLETLETNGSNQQPDNAVLQQIKTMSEQKGRLIEQLGKCNNELTWYKGIVDACIKDGCRVNGQSISDWLNSDDYPLDSDDDEEEEDEEDVEILEEHITVSEREPSEIFESTNMEDSGMGVKTINASHNPWEPMEVNGDDISSVYGNANDGDGPRNPGVSALGESVSYGEVGDGTETDSPQLLKAGDDEEIDILIDNLDTEIRAKIRTEIRANEIKVDTPFPDDSCDSDDGGEEEEKDGDDEAGYEGSYKGIPGAGLNAFVDQPVEQTTELPEGLGDPTYTESEILLQDIDVSDSEMTGELEWDNEDPVGTEKTNRDVEEPINSSDDENSIGNGKSIRDDLIEDLGNTNACAKEVGDEVVGLANGKQEEQRGGSSSDMKGVPNVEVNNIEKSCEAHIGGISNESEDSKSSGFEFDKASTDTEVNKELTGVAAGGAVSSPGRNNLGVEDDSIKLNRRTDATSGARVEFDNTEKKNIIQLKGGKMAGKNPNSQVGGPGHNCQDKRSTVNGEDVSSNNGSNDEESKKSINEEHMKMDTDTTLTIGNTAGGSSEEERKKLLLQMKLMKPRKLRNPLRMKLIKQKRKRKNHSCKNSKTYYKICKDKGSEVNNVCGERLESFHDSSSAGKGSQGGTEAMSTEELRVEVPSNGDNENNNEEGAKDLPTLQEVGKGEEEKGMTEDLEVPLLEGNKEKLDEPHEGESEIDKEREMAEDLEVPLPVGNKDKAKAKEEAGKKAIENVGRAQEEAARKAVEEEAVLKEQEAARIVAEEAAAKRAQEEASRKAVEEEAVLKEQEAARIIAEEAAAKRAEGEASRKAPEEEAVLQEQEAAREVNTDECGSEVHQDTENIDNGKERPVLGCNTMEQRNSNNMNEDVPMMEDGDLEIPLLKESDNRPVESQIASEDKEGEEKPGESIEEKEEKEVLMEEVDREEETKGGEESKEDIEEEKEEEELMEETDEEEEEDKEEMEGGKREWLVEDEDVIKARLFNLAQEGVFKLHNNIALGSGDLPEGFLLLLSDEPEFDKTDFEFAFSEYKGPLFWIQ